MSMTTKNTTTKTPTRRMTAVSGKTTLLITLISYSILSMGQWTKICSAAVIPPLVHSSDAGMWNYLAYELPRRLEKSELVDDPFVRIEKAPGAVTVAREGSNVILECEAIGIPPPVVYWRKNGRRIKQVERDGESNLYEKLTNLGSKTVESSTTVGRLRLDCVDESTTGTYECVAENGHETAVNSTELIILPRDVVSSSLSSSTDRVDDCVRGESIAASSPISPTIVMYTEFRFENEANNAQLFCRASGFPTPKITWLDGNGRPVRMGENRFLLPNGDLFLKNINGYGQYFCVASNEAGEDKVDAFVYATAND